MLQASTLSLSVIAIIIAFSCVLLIGPGLFRLCLVCRSSQQVEDEHHYLFDCPAYSCIRASHANLFQCACSVSDLFDSCEANACGEFIRNCFSLRSSILTRRICINRTLSVGPQFCLSGPIMCTQHSTRGACAVSAAVTLPFGSAVSSVCQHLLDCPLAVMPCRLKSIVHTGNNMQLTVLASIIWGIQLQ